MGSSITVPPDGKTVGGRVHPAASVKVAEPFKVIAISFHDTYNAAEAVAHGAGISDAKTAYIQDPILSPNDRLNRGRTYFILALFTNPTKRPMRFAAATLRFSPRQRQLRAYVRNTVEAGNKAAFIWQAQQDAAPTVCHIQVSDVATGSEAATGFHYSSPVPDKYRTGRDSTYVTLPPAYTRGVQAGPSAKVLATDKPRSV